MYCCNVFDPAAGHCQPLPLPETTGCSPARLGQSPVTSLLLSPGSWCAQGFLVALQESAFQSYISFEGGHHYFHYLHHSLVSGQTTGREHSPAHQQKIGLDIYWQWLHSSKQDPVSLIVSLSHQEAFVSLLSLSLWKWKSLSLLPLFATPWTVHGIL